MGKLIYLNYKGGSDMDRRQDISARVKEVREIYGIYGAAIDPIDITKELQIKVYQKQNLKIKGESVSGAIVKNQDDIVIFLNANDSRLRRRFTLAHEIAHYFLHFEETEEFVDFHRDNKKINNEIESDADEFAACLLMDECEVKKRFKRCEAIPLPLEITINMLSNIFIVSKQAMYIRLRKLGLI